MHWKRVTCELHDSYFRLMTIKHAIPRTAEVAHSDGQLWGDIEWAIELLYNSVKTGSQLVWRSEKLETKCGRESQHLATLENEKDTTLMAIRVGVNMLQFCLVSNSLSHTNLSNKVRGIFFLKTSSTYYALLKNWPCVTSSWFGEVRYIYIYIYMEKNWETQLSKSDEFICIYIYI